MNEELLVAAAELGGEDLGDEATDPGLSAFLRDAIQRLEKEGTLNRVSRVEHGLSRRGEPHGEHGKYPSAQGPARRLGQTRRSPHG